MDYEGYFADDEATFITEIRSIVHSTQYPTMAGSEKVGYSDHSSGRNKAGCLDIRGSSGVLLI